MVLRAQRSIRKERDLQKTCWSIEEMAIEDSHLNFHGGNIQDEMSRIFNFQNVDPNCGE